MFPSPDSAEGNICNLLYYGPTHPTNGLTLTTYEVLEATNVIYKARIIKHPEGSIHTLSKTHYNVSSKDFIKCAHKRTRYNL